MKDMIYGSCCLPTSLRSNCIRHELNIPFFSVFSHMHNTPQKIQTNLSTNQKKHPKNQPTTKKPNKKHAWMLLSSHGTVLEKTGIKSTIWLRSLKINTFLNNSHCCYYTIYVVIKDWYVTTLCRVKQNYFKPDIPAAGSFVLLNGAPN